MGRPKKKDARTRMFKVRLREDEYKMLDNCCRISGKSKSEIIRDAFLIYTTIGDRTFSRIYGPNFKEKLREDDVHG